MTASRQVGEVDRARAIYVHAASLSDPRTDAAFWTEWNDFEVQFGNEDTFREMLRIKRSVAASFSQLHFNTAIIDTAAAPSTGMHRLQVGCKCTRRIALDRCDTLQPDLSGAMLYRHRGGGSWQAQA